MRLIGLEALYPKRKTSVPGKGHRIFSYLLQGVAIELLTAISMGGKGRWRDNVFVERLWRSVKYEEVYLKASLCAQGDESVPEARASLAKTFDFTNR